MPLSTGSDQVCFRIGWKNGVVSFIGICHFILSYMGKDTQEPVTQEKTECGVRL